MFSIRSLPISQTSLLCVGKLVGLCLWMLPSSFVVIENFHTTALCMSLFCCPCKVFYTVIMWAMALGAHDFHILFKCGCNIPEVMNLSTLMSAKWMQTKRRLDVLHHQVWSSSFKKVLFPVLVLLMSVWLGSEEDVCVYVHLCVCRFALIYYRTIIGGWKKQTLVYCCSFGPFVGGGRSLLEGVCQSCVSP